MKRLLTHVLSASLLLVSTSAFGKSEGLYTLEGKATPEALAEGDKGSLQIEIKGQKGAYISEEAPVRVKLSGRNVKVEKASLSRKDVQPGSGKSPRFEVPFVAEAKGEGAVEADMVFFVCTETLCERQAKKITIPVTVK